MDQILNDRSESVLRELEKNGNDPLIKRQASGRLREIRSDQRHVLTQDGREAFMLQYLQREAARFHADDATLETLDADEPRSRPLCTCPDSGCALKDGRLPAAFDGDKSLQRNIREFRHSHYGDPVVLDDAESALDDKVERVISVYDTVLIALSNDIPVPEVEQLGDDDSDAETDADATDSAEVSA